MPPRRDGLRRGANTDHVLRGRVGRAATTHGEQRGAVVVDHAGVHVHAAKQRAVDPEVEAGRLSGDTEVDPRPDRKGAGQVRLYRVMGRHPWPTRTIQTTGGQFDAFTRTNTVCVVEKGMNQMPGLPKLMSVRLVLDVDVPMRNGTCPWCGRPATGRASRPR